MDLEKCNALIHVIDTGSVSKAAKKLGYTPSGLSRMISSLEKDFGFVLLRRNHDGMIPTNECLRILSSIRDLLYQEQVLLQSVSDVKELYVGDIEIGVSHRYYYDLFAKAMDLFNQDFPGVNLKIRHGYSSLLVKELKKHSLDLCIISKRDIGDCRWIPVTTDELLAWIPKEHHLAKQDCIPLSAYESEKVILTYPGEDTDNQRVFKKYHIKPNTQYSTLDSYASYAMVRQGLGISMENGVSSYYFGSDVLFKSLEPKQFIEIGIALQNSPSPAVKEFIRYLVPILDQDEKKRLSVR